MANKQIYELTTRTFNGDSLVPISIENTDPSTSAQYPQLAGKTSGNAISDFIANNQQYVTDLDTQNKTITGAINEHKSVIGYSYDAYDATTAYSTDDLCIYNNVLYKAKQATTGNLPTNTTYWEETSIADEIGRIDTALSGKADKAVITNISTVSDTVATSTDLDIYSVSLNKGIYIFNGSTLWKTSGTAQGLTMIALLGADTLVQNLEYTVGWCVENLTCIFAVTTDNTTFKVRLYQTTGSNVAVDFSGNLTKIS